MTDFAAAEAILTLSTAYWASRVLHVIAGAGIADVLDDEPQTAAALAAKAGVHPEVLHRMLRCLANHGVFTLSGGRFAHNAASRILRSDAPGSMRGRGIMDGLPVHWDAYRGLDDSLKTGRPGIEAVLDGGLFPYLATHPYEARVFQEAMVGKSYEQVGEVIGAYDFTGLDTIGDIGGGIGHLLSAVLEKYPASKGVLFELPAAIAQAREAPHPRIAYVGGDFFKDPVPPCDAYMLMMVLHDWSDDECLAILKNIAATAPAGAKYLIIEGMIDEDRIGDFIADLDIEMLAWTTGRERTRAEWEELLDRAGLMLARVVPMGGFSCIVEAVARD